MNDLWRWHMTRRWLLLIVATVGLAVLCVFPKSEYTFEFDGANYRLRECSRSRSWLFGFVLWEQCSPPTDHPTALRLRELRVIPPVSEGDSRWLLIKGFTSGVRGWKGAGSYYVRALGATTFGTPVTLPAAEDLSDNVWVRWAKKDAEAAKHFWQEAPALAISAPDGDWRAAEYLRTAAEFLEERKLNVPGAQVEAHARQAAEG